MPINESDGEIKVSIRDPRIDPEPGDIVHLYDKPHHIYMFVVSVVDDTVYIRSNGKADYTKIDGWRSETAKFAVEVMSAGEDPYMRKVDPL